MKKIKALATAATIAITTLIPTIAAKAIDVNYTFGNGIGFEGQLGLGTRDIRLTIGSLISVVIGFLGIVATLIILLGGFTWMTAAGNEEKVGKAKKMIIGGIIGLIIILAAFAIAKFAINSIISAT
jgi:hypothetical protein